MASKFFFNTTKSIICEVGSASSRIGDVFKSMGCRPQQTLLLVTDKGLQDMNISEPCIRGLTNMGFNIQVFSGVVADPAEANILDAVELAKQKNVAGIIGFGGGSSMDVAKLVAFLAHKDCKQQLSDIYGVDQCVGHRLPLVQVPTTAGTGSEVTPISIVTTGASEKKGIVSAQLLPDCAVLDGELTLSLPAHITAATGIDAMVHAIEAYTTKLKKNPLSDVLAKDALRLLGKNIRTVCSEQGARNANARGEMLLGSLFAGMAFANAPVGAVHALAYPIGSHFKVPHGLSNSLMLPYVNYYKYCCIKYYVVLKSTIDYGVHNHLHLCHTACSIYAMCV